MFPKNFSDSFINGCADLSILEKLSPHIDVMNIDLKGFTNRYYADILSGDRKTVMNFIRDAVKKCHVERTTLVVPGETDSETKMRELSSWVAGLRDVHDGKPGREILPHNFRFLPRYRMAGWKPTNVKKVYSLEKMAEETSGMYTRGTADRKSGTGSAKKGGPGAFFHGRAMVYLYGKIAKEGAQDGRNRISVQRGHAGCMSPLYACR